MTVPLDAGTRIGLPVQPWPSTGPVLPDVPSPAAASGLRWTVTTVDPGSGSGGVPDVGDAGSHAPRRAVPARAAAEPSAVAVAAAVAVAVDPAAGWSSAGDTWQHDAPAVTATVRAHEQHDADGRALLAALRARTPDDLGAPDVTELPDDLADGLLVVRRQVRGGTLVLRVDLARRAWDTEVLVSAVVPDPAVADDAVTALVRLLAAIGPGHDRLTA